MFSQEPLKRPTDFLRQKNVYVFDVPLNANKDQIREAVESQYKVKVMNIKTLVQNGKAIRASRGKRAYPKVVNP